MDWSKLLGENLLYTLTLLAGVGTGLKLVEWLQYQRMAAGLLREGGGLLLKEREALAGFVLAGGDALTGAERVLGGLRILGVRATTWNHLAGMAPLGILTLGLTAVGYAVRWHYSYWEILVWLAYTVVTALLCVFGQELLSERRVRERLRVELMYRAGLFAAAKKAETEATPERADDALAKAAEKGAAAGNEKEEAITEGRLVIPLAQKPSKIEKRRRAEAKALRHQEQLRKQYEEKRKRLEAKYSQLMEQATGICSVSDLPNPELAGVMSGSSEAVRLAGVMTGSSEAVRLAGVMSGGSESIKTAGVLNGNAESVRAAGVATGSQAASKAAGQKIQKGKNPDFVEDVFREYLISAKGNDIIGRNYP